MTGEDRRLASALAMVRGGYGAALLLATGRMIRLVTGRPPDQRTRVVVRVLGVRHLAQAVVTGVRPGPLPIAVGVEVDAVHAASMLGLAAMTRSQRRCGLVDAAVAMAFALAGAALTRRMMTGTPPQGDDGLVGWLSSVRDAVAASVARRTLPAPVRRAMPELSESQAR
jgi:hypothetical protein